MLEDFVRKHSNSKGNEVCQVELGVSRLEGKGSAVFIAETAGEINAEVQTMFREVFHIHGVRVFATRDSLILAEDLYSRTYPSTPFWLQRTLSRSSTKAGASASLWPVGWH